MVLVLGIGNSLLQDEGFAYHLLDRLNHEKPHWPVKLLDGGTLSFSLVTSIEVSTHLIVIDAANFKQAPGTVKILLNDSIDTFLSKPGKSVHEVSLSEIFDMARLTNSLPTQRAMIAVQPQEISWGENLTEQVQAALPIAVDEIEKILKNWEVIPTISNTVKLTDPEIKEAEHES